MAKYTKGHKQVNCYADGGKVEPTFGRALMARVGIGDGYGNAKAKPKPKRMDVSNAKDTLGTVVSKRKKMLDEI